jgi:hypothetical protein
MRSPSRTLFARLLVLVTNLPLIGGLGPGPRIKSGASFPARIASLASGAGMTQVDSSALLRDGRKPCGHVPACILERAAP